MHRYPLHKKELNHIFLFIIFGNLKLNAGPSIEVFVKIYKSIQVKTKTFREKGGTHCHQLHMKPITIYYNIFHARNYVHKRHRIPLLKEIILLIPNLSLSRPPLVIPNLNR